MIQLGLACFCIWAVNWIYLFRMVIKQTPDWLNKEVDADTIYNNFPQNTPTEKLQLFQTLVQMNPSILLSAMVLLLFGLLV